MENFEVLDVSGDIGIRAYGKTITEAFVSASTGLYSLTTNLNAIEAKKSIDISVESDTLEGLLVSWLNELIFHLDAYGFIGKKILINEFSPIAGKPDSLRACKLKAIIYGEEFDPVRHEGKLLIKAATYHRLKIEKKKDGLWEIDVIFDI